MEFIILTISIIVVAVMGYYMMKLAATRDPSTNNR